MGNRLKPFVSCRLRRLRGVATVEFSILIVPLLLLLFGVTEYGRAIYQYNTLTKSVRNAARYLSTVQAGNGYAAARCLAVYGTTNCSGAPLAPGLTTGMVTICDASIPSCQATHLSQQTGQGTVNLVTVTINDPSLPDNQKFHFDSVFNFTLYGLNFGAPNITYHPIRNTMRQAS